MALDKEHQLAVPDYQTLMAPALQALSDGQPKSSRQVREDVGARLGITEDDRAELVKSGAQSSTAECAGL